MSEFSNYHKAIAYLESLANIPLRKDYMSERNNPIVYLRRTEELLSRLGNPERGIKIIHVTGTSGKGTVSTMLANILHAEGKRVGLFTSPHVTTCIERIWSDSFYISPDEFVRGIERLKPVIDEMHATGKYGRPGIFEVLLAIAFLYFKDRKCEWVVLEVGCGGSYDATNVVERPAVTVITSIDYDHTDLLGKTLKKIATDKAGIIKKNSLFWTAEARPALRKLFRAVCENKGASYHEFQAKGQSDYNAAFSESIAKSIGVSTQAIEKGIAAAQLPARFETVQTKPLVIIDGAHNRSKIAHTLRQLAGLTYKKLIVVFAIADNKDAVQILPPIAAVADRCYFTRFQSKDRKPKDPVVLERLARRWRKKGSLARVFLDATQALERAVAEAGQGDCVLVTGSFYLAGELRERFTPEKYVLENRVSF